MAQSSPLQFARPVGRLARQLGRRWGNAGARANARAAKSQLALPDRIDRELLAKRSDRSINHQFTRDFLHPSTGPH